jgi:hypothetical protein
MSLRQEICALFASAGMLAGIPAVATTIIVPEPLRAPDCRDPPPADPALRYESLPTHAQITEYLADERSRPRYTCSSARLNYEGTRDENGIRVISKYQAGGPVHAETYTQRQTRIGGMRKHGVVRARSRDGKVQSLEYFCHGFEVGFHRYFAANGELAAVVDYSRSDYELQKPLDGGRFYREFYLPMGRLSSPTGLARVQRFREVYRISGERAERVAFAAADEFDRTWQPLDPASTVRQWTEPGLHGPVSYSGQPTQISNLDFHYLSFAEVYQRKRLGTPGTREPRDYHSLLLECPWIDEAMQPGLTDERFSFDPLPQYTESQRAASPQQQFATCLRDPNVSCLLEQALASARYSQPLYGNEMLAFAEVALVAAKPALARTAMEEVLANTKGFTLPNPAFARQAAIKAEAETALVLHDESKKSADAALASAMGLNTHGAGKAVHILEAVGPRLARAGHIDKAREAIGAVPPQYAKDSPLTLEAIGIAQARHTDVVAARSIVEELAAAGKHAPAGRQAADRINGEIAVSLARAGKAAESIASLHEVERPSSRVWFLAQLTAIASDGNDQVLLAATANLWRASFDDLQRAVEEATGVDERRRLYHAYLAVLRMKNTAGTDSQRADALEALRSNLTSFATADARVRAGCELAFTLQQVGQSSAAAALFAESQQIKIESGAAAGDLPFRKPPPVGACAYWMNAAGMAGQASSAVEQVIGARRDWLTSRGDGPRADAQRTLMELALILSEAESGEIDWSTGTRLTQT